MIKDMIPLSMGEAEEFIEGKKDSEIDIKSFIKKFSKLNSKKAKELREKIEELNILKLNPIIISKIIDLLPRDKEELNKVASSAGLDEDEINKILETIKSYI